MKLKITVIKAILEQAKYCGTSKFNFERERITESCAVALAVRDIFPNASVSSSMISMKVGNKLFFICIPGRVGNYINKFDSYARLPLEEAVKARLNLPEITFTVDVPDELISQIDISNVYEGHPTLELINE